jgi:hypothetical protein
MQAVIAQSSNPLIRIREPLADVKGKVSQSCGVQDLAKIGCAGFAAGKQRRFWYDT